MAFDEKILTFQKMTEAHPENELNHFSLGKAYFDAGDFEHAIPSFKKVIELNPKFSRAYQMLGESLKAVDRIKDAVDILKLGYSTANQQGDIMPRDAMAALLTELGAPIPQTQKAQAPARTDVSASMLQCSRCKMPEEKLPKPPFPGALGQKIFSQICRRCWEEWMGMGTKVINELRLDLTTTAGSAAYDAHMKEFLQL